MTVLLLVAMEERKGKNILVAPRSYKNDGALAFSTTESKKRYKATTEMIAISLQRVPCDGDIGTRSRRMDEDYRSIHW